MPINLKSFLSELSQNIASIGTSLSENLEEHSSELRQYILNIGESLPELNYITFTGTTLAADGSCQNSLVNTNAISPKASTGIAMGWNYLDSLCSLIVAADLLYQIENDEVSDQQKKENALKAGLLTTSGLTLLIMTAIGPGALGFAISTMFDFSIACGDFYKASRSSLSFDYWLEQQLIQLEFLTAKLKDNDLSETEIEEYKVQKNNIIENIEAYSYYHYQRYSDISCGKNTILRLEKEIHKKVDRTFNKGSFKHIQKEDIKGSIKLTSPSNRDYLLDKGHQVKESIKDNLEDSGVNLALKTASMVGMTILAVTAVAHPVALSITVGVAASYLIYKFGLPASKKLYNKLFNKHQDNSPTQRYPRNLLLDYDHGDLSLRNMTRAIFVPLP